MAFLYLSVYADEWPDDDDEEEEVDEADEDDDEEAEEDEDEADEDEGESDICGLASMRHGAFDMSSEARNSGHMSSKSILLRISFSLLLRIMFLMSFSLFLRAKLMFAAVVDETTTADGDDEALTVVSFLLHTLFDDLIEDCRDGCLTRTLSMTTRERSLSPVYFTIS